MNLDHIVNLDSAIQEAKLLAAEPFMADANFKRAVILICEHNIDGTLGFILNKSLDMQVNELLTDFPDFESIVYFGGPVQTDTIHYIHDCGDILPDSVEIAKGLYWGGDFNILKTLIRTEVIKPQNIRFFVGYTGWSTGQLVEEINAHTWILGKFDLNYIFKLYKEPNKLWKQVLQHKGDAYSIISQVSDDLSWS